jgi:mannonate dehydratase
MANEVWRSSLEAPGRGGARVTTFDLSLVAADVPTHGRVFSEAEIWENFLLFAERVLPVAETAGVRLALHPDDPPLPVIGGIARIFGSQVGLQRAVDTCDSPAFQLDFCIGSVSEIGPGAIDVMRSFAEQGKIAYIHFRDVKGHVPVFEECFLDEGNVDAAEALRVLRDASFDGFIIDDHVPLLDGDPAIAEEWTRSEYAYLGRAFANGYIAGLLRAVLSEPAREAGRTVV